MKPSLEIRAGKLYTPEAQPAGVSIWIEGDSIVEVGAGRHAADRLLEAPVVAPGMIDLHINGAGGGDAADGTVAALRKMAQAQARHGTTGFVPTLITGPDDLLVNASAGLAAAWSQPCGGARPLGIHLEGPFLSPARRGAHPAQYLQPPSQSLWDAVQHASGNRYVMLTLAPELPGALELIEHVRDQIPIRSVGHSDATYQEVRAALDSGANFATHVFNAMRELSHREPGIAGAVLSEPIAVELIADGVHVHPAMVRLVAAAKGPDLLILVTDAIAAADMPDGVYELGTLRVVVRDGICRGTEGQLAGSTLTMDVALRNLQRWTSWPLADCLRTVTSNPARMLGLQSTKGTLHPGADADVVLFSDTLEVQATVVAGEVVWEAGMIHEASPQGS